jgi:hypothetical protein
MTTPASLPEPQVFKLKSVATSKSHHVGQFAATRVKFAGNQKMLLYRDTSDPADEEDDDGEEEAAAAKEPEPVDWQDKKRSSRRPTTQMTKREIGQPLRVCLCV